MRLALFVVIIIVGSLAVYAQLLSEQLSRPAEFQRQNRSIISQPRGVPSHT